jgi:bifunctional UDP-N-acetylglucosamine pyrophosphorylase/glucosamine-1-phosphate N-acetyltransferase
MRTTRPKVLHRAGGLPLVEHVLRAAARLAPASMVVVVGHLAEQVQAAVALWPGVQVVHQDPRGGTAHALLQAVTAWAHRGGTLVVVPGDAPLVRPETLRRLLDHHRTSGAAATVLTGVLDHPYGHPRLVRAAGAPARVVPEEEASPAERRIREVASDVWALDPAPLLPVLGRLRARHGRGESDLSDLVSAYRRRRLRVETLAGDPAELRDVNSLSDLAEVEAAVRHGKNEELMGAGVTLVDPATTYVDVDVTVGRDTVLHPNVYLEGRTTIGAACEIHAGVRIVDSTLGDRVVVENFCVIEGARIASGARIGPFAHLRPGTDVREDARIGNFVELKQTVFGAGSKANHLTYLGDAIVGERVNVGAGTITCNYDGERKHQTVIEDEAFIGSDTQLVAPVRVGRGAYVAAGSSITRDVPPGALGIARGQQVNKEGWVARKKAKTP